MILPGNQIIYLFIYSKSLIFRKPVPAPKATSSAKPYDTSSFLKSFAGQDSDDEVDMFVRKTKPKSIMFKDDDDVDDFFM